MICHAPDIFTAAFAIFRGAYCDLLSACEGAPVHDAHVVAYLTNPELYENKTVAIDVAVAQPGDDAHGMVVVDRRSWADATAPRVTYGPEGLDDYLGSTLTYSQVPPRANAAVKVVTVLTGVDSEGFREQLAFRFRKNAMRYFTKY